MESQALLESNENCLTLDGIEPLILSPEKVAKLHECQNFLEAAKSELSEVIGGAEMDVEVRNVLARILQGIEFNYEQLLEVTD